MSLQDLLTVVPAGSDEEELVRSIDFGRLPRHVAVIMDGNGRWAQLRHKRRVEGHRAGIQAVRATVETSARIGLEVLTLYAFSIENWKRPQSEVSTLMGLLKRYLRSELHTLLDNGIRFRVLGRTSELPGDVQDELRRAEERTSANEGLRFNIALNYGGRAEITDAVRELFVELLHDGRDPALIDERALAAHLYTAGQPDPDLLIRTSGELRISNFLLWQIAYAEIWVTDVLWPDFRRRHLLQAISDYQKRERRYGGITTV
jgi:undecaprenyl diphosphate synthase